MKIDNKLKPEALAPAIDAFFATAAHKIRALDKAWDPRRGAPVFTIRGKYATRGWTEWTQGFQYGCQILQFDADGDEAFLEMGRRNTFRHMAPHITHTGVHDHGFNNVSTYGNLRRLAREKRWEASPDAMAFLELALKASGAVQAARWTVTADGTGFIHSFNGPHSLFSDTLRSCRALVLAHQLGHALMGENDRRHSLLDRAIQHIHNTARYNVYYGEGRDHYDTEPGRVAHESIFNTADGHYRCPSSQQGYSPFTTWTRGLAWILLGGAELLEYFDAVPDKTLAECALGPGIRDTLLRMTVAAAAGYQRAAASDGIPYWDTGAPGLVHLPDWRERPADPENPHEPVDSSAAAIAAQGLLRLGKRLGAAREGKTYWQAGLTVARTLLAPPYACQNSRRHGILLHAIYHRPNGWDHQPSGAPTPRGEAALWGDYHAMELALYLKRIIKRAPYLTFF